MTPPTATERLAVELAKIAAAIVAIQFTLAQIGVNVCDVKRTQERGFGSGFWDCLKILLQKKGSERWLIVILVVLLALSTGSSLPEILPSLVRIFAPTTVISLGQ